MRKDCFYSLGFVILFTQPRKIQFSHPEQAYKRAVLEIWDYTEGKENLSLRIAVAVLSDENDNASMNVVMKATMRRLLLEKHCADVVVYVTGVTFTPFEKANCLESGRAVPGCLEMDYMVLGHNEDDNRFDENYTVEGEGSQDSNDSDKSDPLSTFRILSKIVMPVVEFKGAVSHDPGTQYGK